MANRFTYEKSLAYIYIDNRHPELRKERRTLVNHLSLARSWMPQVVSEGWSFVYSGKAALQETVSHGPYNTAIFNSERDRTHSPRLRWYAKLCNNVRRAWLVLEDFSSSTALKTYILIPAM